MEPFKKAKIFDAGGDLEQRWFVFYYYLNPDTGKYQRFREWIPRTIYTAAGRRDRAHEMIKKINLKLIQGFNPFLAQEKRLTTISSALEFALDIKKNTTRKRTYHTYRYTVKSLLVWLKKTGRENMPVDNFGKQHAQAFTDYSILELHLYNATVNYRTLHLRVMFKVLMKREYIVFNPFDGIEKLPVEEAEIVTFTKDELIQMDEFLPAWDFNLYAIACLIFYCFIRPQEIVRLQVHHICLSDRSIRIPGSRSKNKKSEMVQIPDALIPVLVRLELDKYPADHFIFSKEFHRGLKEIAPTRIAGAWREFGNQFGISKNIYSLKHTGAGMAVEAGINLRDLQLQLRHSSLEFTQIYLDKFKRRPSDQLNSHFPDLSQLTKNTLPARLLPGGSKYNLFLS